MPRPFLCVVAGLLFMTVSTVMALPTAAPTPALT
jgi:hypothetical protein